MDFGGGEEGGLYIYICEYQYIIFDVLFGGGREGRRGGGERQLSAMMKFMLWMQVGEIFVISVNRQK